MSNLGPREGRRRDLLQSAAVDQDRVERLIPFGCCALEEESLAVGRVAAEVVLTGGIRRYLLQTSAVR